MYVATMEYPLLPGATEKAARLWESTVVESASQQPGFVRIQLLSSPSALLATGTWQSKDDAEAFMRTGVFHVLKEKLAPYLAGDPLPRLWTLEAFVSR